MSFSGEIEAEVNGEVDQRRAVSPSAFGGFPLHDHSHTSAHVAQSSRPVPSILFTPIINIPDAPLRRTENASIPKQSIVQ